MQIPNTRRMTNSPIDSSLSQSQIQYAYPPLEFSFKPLTTTFEPQENPSSRSYSSTSIDTMIPDLFSPTSSSSASSDSLLMSGDYIGMESSVNVLSDDELSFISCHHDCYSQRKERLCWARKKEKKRTYEELPPPISLLARTENLPSHMPWVLKRHYTTDGRLILTEEKVRHHEYFRAHRSNGRLRLQLVPLDGQVLVPPIVCCGDDHEEEKVDDHDGLHGYCCEYKHDVLYDDNLDAYDGDNDSYDYDYDCHYDYDYDDDDNCDGLHRQDDVEQTINVVNSSTASAGKCLNINTTVRTESSCILGEPAPVIRCVEGNTNGSGKGFLGQAGFGGLFRCHASQVMTSAFCEPIRISFTHTAKLAAFVFAMITAWEKGWLRYSWIQSLSWSYLFWSYLFSLNPYLLFGLCVLSGEIVVI